MSLDLTQIRSSPSFPSFKEIQVLAESQLDPSLLAQYMAEKNLQVVPRQAGSFPQIPTGQRVKLSQAHERDMGGAPKPTIPTGNQNQVGIAGSASMAARLDT